MIRMCPVVVSSLSAFGLAQYSTFYHKCCCGASQEFDDTFTNEREDDADFDESMYLLSRTRALRAQPLLITNELVCDCDRCESSRITRHILQMCTRDRNHCVTAVQ
jgi:hypothetical protein